MNTLETTPTQHAEAQLAKARQALMDANGNLEDARKQVEIAKTNVRLAVIFAEEMRLQENRYKENSLVPST